MIRFSRIYAVFLRYFYTITGLHQIAELFFWPLIDILLWGLTTAWLAQQGEMPGKLPLIILTGLVFWQILLRGSYEIAVNLLQEFWNRNLVNLFSTPLHILEWTIGVILLCICKMAISLSFGALLIYLLYTLNVFTLGWAFLPYACSLLISGWILGFLASSLIIRYGQKLEMLAWMTAALFAPFSAIFYPVDSLPHWAQCIAFYLPMTYIFEGMRLILNEGIFSWGYFCMSLGLNCVYLVGAITLFTFSFEFSRARGLNRLE